METQSKTIVFVNGLDPEVDEKTLHNAFIPFGDIIEVTLPPDSSSSNRHKGFGFVEFEEPEDAASAIDNMDESMLFGRTITVRLSKTPNNRSSVRAVYTDN